MRLVFKGAIAKIKEQQDIPEFLSNKFKRLLNVEEEKLEMIVSTADGGAVRASLCRFYQMSGVEVGALGCMIL